LSLSGVVAVSHGVERNVGEKQRLRASRAAAVLVVLALHGALLLLSGEPPPRRASPGFPEPALELFWLDPLPAALPEKTPQPARDPSKATPASTPVEPSTAITPGALPEQPPRIDWNAQARDAAEAYVLRQEQEARQRARFAPREPFARLESKEKLDRGWRFDGHNRIDTSSGIPVFHINERCVLVGFLLPACAIGKIRPSGEMYQGYQEWLRLRDEWEQRH